MIEYCDLSISDSLDISIIEKETFSDPWSLDVIKETFNFGLYTYYGAKDNGKLIAYCGYDKVIDEFHIGNIAVVRTYRRQHIADNMIKEVIKRAKEQNVVGITLEVRESNKAAINLYLNNGFVNSGIRPHYYQDGENAIIMWKHL